MKSLKIVLIHNPTQHENEAFENRPDEKEVPSDGITLARIEGPITVNMKLVMTRSKMLLMFSWNWSAIYSEYEIDTNDICDDKIKKAA